MSIEAASENLIHLLFFHVPVTSILAIDLCVLIVSEFMPSFDLLVVA